jgi:DNA repair exonuclease SbcCD ATPase subunit
MSAQQSNVMNMSWGMNSEKFLNQTPNNVFCSSLEEIKQKADDLEQFLDYQKDQSKTFSERKVSVSCLRKKLKNPLIRENPYKKNVTWEYDISEKTDDFNRQIKNLNQKITTLESSEKKEELRAKKYGVIYTRKSSTDEKIQQLSQQIQELKQQIAAIHINNKLYEEENVKISQEVKTYCDNIRQQLAELTNVLIEPAEMDEKSEKVLVNNLKYLKAFPRYAEYYLKEFDEDPDKYTSLYELVEQVNEHRFKLYIAERKKNEPFAWFKNKTSNSCEEYCEGWDWESSTCQCGAFEIFFDHGIDDFGDLNKVDLNTEFHGTVQINNMY